jgi:NADPH:quinone reductase-like Zn-dependent oxidoreductase/acyl carrier protein
VLTAHLFLRDEQGALLLHIDRLRLQRVNAHMLNRAAAAPYQQWLYEVTWEAQPLTAVPPTKPLRWLLLADRGDVAQSVAEQLTAHGQSCTLLEQAAWPTLTAETLPLVDRVVDFWNLDLPMDGEPTAVQEQLLGHTLALVQALAERPEPPRLWLGTRGAQPVLPGEAVAVAQTSLAGLVRVIAQELPELDCTQLDLDPGGDISALADELMHGSGEIQVAFRDGIRYVPRLARHVPTAIATDGPVQLDIRERGVLDNLALHPADRPAPGPGEVEIEIVASGLNFRDVLNALGMYPEAAPLGGECAGRITAVGPNVTQFQIGDEVMALTPHAFSTYVVTLADLVALKPKAMSFTEAAGIPIVFLTAEYALNHLGHMQAGSKVLIHAAAGGVGMAAIQLAQRAGAEVYATASPPKWATLRQMGLQHLYNSRTLDFAEAIAADTHGAGVQIALNSLAGEFIPKTLGLVASGGHFVEIGRTGTWNDATVAADYPGVHNHVFFLGQLCLDEPHVVQTMLQAVLAGFADGSLRPLPTRVYDIAQVVEAFRFMAQARHVGKIVISQSRATVRPQSEATYLITGGLGSLGLRVGRWLAEQGAGHLVLVGRREPSPAAQEVLAEIEGLGTAVHLFSADIAEPGAVDQILTTIDGKLPPLRGIVHAAGVLDDGLLLNQSWARFERVLAPKVAGAWQLHQATLGQALDFFVLFSSTSALLGATGQSNYAAANAFLDGLAHYRRALGLPGLSINWGAWAEGGMAEAVNQGNNLAALGIRTIATRQGLAVLEQLLGESVPQVGVLPVDWHIFSRQLPLDRQPPFLARMLEQTAVSPSQSGASAAGPGAFAARLAAARPDEQPILLREHVCNQARQVLGLSSTVEVDTKRPLLEMGLDSLMSVELRNALGQSLNQSLPASLLFDYPTINALTDFLIELFWLKHLPPTNAENAEEREEFEL